MIDYLRLNEMFRQSFLEESVAFHAASNNVQRVQENKLLETVRSNQDTEIGRRFNFDSIKSVADFIEAVPVLSYEDYQEAIINIMDGEQRVLTSEQVLSLEPTSGSTSPSKFIPYTEALKREFQQGIFPWLYDLFTNRPNLKNGSFYWSITPATHKEERTSGGIPIGFGDDGIYFTPQQQRLISELSAVPFDVAKIQDVGEFKKQTLAHLSGNKDLSFISVWNPTFLSLLLRPINKPQEVWPNLSLISAWADGNASNYIGEIRRLFPNAEIQPKGLIATEGFVSLPLIGYEGSALSVNSHFFEFRDLERGSDVRLAHQVEKGKEYEVILTTGGGLYRYNLEDVVKVVGFKDQCPLVRFVGRNHEVSDLFGEKLNDYHVSRATAETLRKNSLAPSFFMIAPEALGETTSYVLFVESERRFNSDSIVEDLDSRLQENYHYKYCRKLGQLGKPKVFLINRNPDRSASDIYLEENNAKGKKMGNVKPAVLSSQFGWSKRFDGQFIV